MNIKNYMWLLCFLLLLGCSNQEPKMTPTKSNLVQLNTEVMDNGVVLKRVMVLVKRGYNPEEIVASYEGTIEQSYIELNAVSAFIPENSIRNVMNDTRVLHVEQDQIVELQPSQSQEWHTSNVQAPRAWSTQYTGKGVKVGVLDTGISPHEDLVLSGGVSMTTYTNSYHDDNGHGTHVAGVIAAIDNTVGIIGIAPEASLYAIKVLNQNGEGYLSDVIAGVDWAIQNGMDIINLSLGSPSSSDMLRLIVEKAYNHNILVIAAAGNTGTPAGLEDNVHFPARYNSVIAVSAVDQQNKRASFSSTGSTVEIAAPGVGILSTYLNNQYVRMDGTSFASPIVAGVAALIKQAEPNLTNKQIREKLQRDTLDLGDNGRDPWFGFGLVQAPYPFTDIVNHWAETDIISAFNRKWMLGTTSSTFSPNTELTRAQAATIISRILKLADNGQPIPNFTDVPQNHWAKRNIDLVAQHGVMLGSAGRFSPEVALTREQLVVILYRVINPDASGQLNPFEDISATRWSYKEIIAMNELGIVRGVTPTKFDPIKATNRAQISVMLNRAVPYLPK